MIYLLYAVFAIIGIVVLLLLIAVIRTLLLKPPVKTDIHLTHKTTTAYSKTL